MSYTADKDPHRVAGGLKAATRNPRVTDEGKAEARERLENMDDVDVTVGGLQGSREPAEGDTISGRQAGGYKATLKNPNVSEEAKEHAEHVLETKNQQYAADVQEVDANRQQAGYKATLHNPDTSSEAKRHAKEVLDEEYS